MKQDVLKSMRWMLAGAAWLSLGTGLGQTLTLDSIVSGEITKPGQKVSYTFNGTSGQRLFYDGIDNDFDSIAVRLLAPNGQPYVLGGNNSDSDSNNPFFLVEPGTYTLEIDGNGAAVGDFRFRLIDLAGATALPFDVPVSRSLSPGTSSDWFSFQGKAGDIIFFDSLAAVSGANWGLFGPGNEGVAGGGGVGNDFEAVLPRSGTYYLTVVGGSPNTVQYVFLATRPEPSTKPLALGTDISGELLVPGEKHVYTFSGTAGQRLYLDSLDRDAESISIQILNPAGQAIVSVNHNTDSGPITFIQNGEYQLVVDGSAATVGDYRFRLIDLATAPLRAVPDTIDGSLAPRSRTQIYRFDAAAGNRISFDSIFVTGNEATWRIVNALNQNLASGSIQSDQASIFLNHTGPAYLLIEGNGELASAIQYQVRLATVSVPQSQVLGLDTMITGSVTAPVVVTNSFTAPAGRWIYFDTQTGQASGVSVEIRSPSGAILTGFNGSSESNPFQLVESGEHKIRISGNGEYRFRLIDMILVPELPLNSSVSADLQPGFRTDIFRFSGTPGQRYAYDALDNDSDQVSARVFAPDGSFPLNGNSDTDQGGILIRQLGTHYLIVEGRLAEPGNYAFRFLRLEDAPTIGFEVPITATLDPGLMVLPYVFQGTKGQLIYLDAAATNAGSAFFSLFAPNNQNIAFANISQDFELLLQETGEYLLYVGGNTTNKLTFTMQMFDPNGANKNGPDFTLVERAGNSVTLEWRSKPGKTYTVQFKNNLGEGSWTDLPGAIPSAGSITEKVDNVGAAPSRFYRVKENP